MKKYIDLSLPIQPTSSEATPVVISPLSHREAPRVFNLEPHDFPDEMGISNEEVSLTTHTGTHMDAPFHYGPLSEGKPARTIADIPLGWCYNRGVRLDVRHRGVGETISEMDIRYAEEQAGTTIKPDDIVLVWTGSDRYWGKKSYLTDYPGMSRGAVAYLIDQGVHIIGIDAWGLDRPMAAMLRDYKATGDRSCLWPAHIYGRTREYCQLEKLANLHLLPYSYGFTVACFPVLIDNVGAAWTRVIAVFE